MSNTPRTEALFKQLIAEGCDFTRPANQMDRLARKLEHELADAFAISDKWQRRYEAGEEYAVALQEAVLVMEAAPYPTKFWEAFHAAIALAKNPNPSGLAGVPPGSGAASPGDNEASLRLRGVASGPVGLGPGSDDEEVRSLAVGGAQLTQGGGDSAGMPLSVGRSRPDQTATSSSASERTVLDPPNAELELARKLFWLSARDFIFWGSYNAAKKDWDDGAYPAINTNDTFVYGADAEHLPLSDVDEYVAVCRRFGDHNGFDGAYVAAKTGQKRVKGSPESKAAFERLAEEIREFLRTWNSSGNALEPKA